MKEKYDSPTAVEGVFAQKIKSAKLSPNDFNIKSTDYDASVSYKGGEVFFTYKVTPDKNYVINCIPTIEIEENVARDFDFILLLFDKWLLLIQSDIFISKSKINEAETVSSKEKVEGSVKASSKVEATVKAHKVDTLENMPIQFYAVGTYWGKNEDQSARFLKEEIWETGKETEDSAIINIVESGDVLVMKSTYAGKFRIKAVGFVQNNSDDGRTLKVKWHNPYYEEEQYLNENSPWIDIKGSLSKHRSTITKIKNTDDISEIFSYLPNIAAIVQEKIHASNIQKIEKDAPVTIINEPENDVLGASLVAELMINMVVSSDNENSLKKEEEQFYGIFGQWGRGKTYLWKQIKDRVNNEINKSSQKLIPIEFHAWKYQDTPGIWAYLYETFVKKYYDRPTNGVLSLWSYVRYVIRVIRLNYYRGNVISPLWSLVFAGLSAFLLYNDFDLLQKLYVGNIIGGSFGLIAMYNLYKSLGKNYSTKAKDYIKRITQKVSYADHLGMQHEIQEELKSLLKAWIGKSDKRILLFIDDIDRCSEDKIIDIVDAIRVMLDNPEMSDKIVAMAAIDERILKMAIEEKYKHVPEEDSKSANFTRSQLAREYMDKLFIAGIKLSPLTSTEKGKILNGFLGDKVRTTHSKSEENVEDSTSIDDILTENQETNLKWNGFDFSSKLILSETLESNYQLSTEEFEELNLQILTFERATPRSIRAYGIRYRLGKGIMSFMLEEGSEEFEEWHHKNYTTKRFFAADLLNKMKNPQHKVDESLYSTMLADKVNNILEMVVPY